MPPKESEITRGEKLQALLRVAKWRPKLTFTLIVFGGGVAFFEGIGLTFIYPIIEVAQTDEPVEATDMVMQLFLDIYAFLDLPFTLGYLIAGVAVMMSLRYLSSFLVAWFRAILRQRFEMEMRRRAFDAALNAKIRYFDEEGSDDILNAIITETRYSGHVISYGVRSLETIFLASMYLAVMLFIAPAMTVLAFVLLGGITILLRHVIEPGITVGSRVAKANERVQQSVQAGTQGIRDVKLFGVAGEVYDSFEESLRTYTQSSIDLARNEAGIKNFYELSAALTLFILIYVGFIFTGLSLGALGIFLFAMFQLAPLASRLNTHIYKLEGNLAHLVRTQAFIDELNGLREDDGNRSVDEVTKIAFEDVSFSYNGDERVLEDISFEVEKGEFIAFVGQSGAGKSTIVSLLTRLYKPDKGRITADGMLIEEYNLEQWRERIAVVRQHPFIFNDTLVNNVTVGNREAKRSDVERVCQIAKVDEFVDDLPNGYESQLGDDGVRLSGGQRQRVSLARALLKDADFLLLDEATSDLDSNLERKVQQSIEEMDTEYGIIAIAHRLSTVENAEVIYTLEQGRITESGTHVDLVDSGGKYAELYEIQAR